MSISAPISLPLITDMTEEKKQEFEKVTRPVIEWLNNNCNPHCVTIIDPTSAVLYGGEVTYTTHDYLKD